MLVWTHCFGGKLRARITFAACETYLHRHLERSSDQIINRNVYLFRSQIKEALKLRKRSRWNVNTLHLLIVVVVKFKVYFSDYTLYVLLYLNINITVVKYLVDFVLLIHLYVCFIVRFPLRNFELP